MTNKNEQICQSCAMPLNANNSDQRGTEADGGRNNEYCQYCYENGDFKDSTLTVDQEIDKVVQIAVSQMQMPEDEARAWAEKVIPKLKRWAE